MAVRGDPQYFLIVRRLVPNDLEISEVSFMHVADAALVLAHAQEKVANAKSYLIGSVRISKEEWRVPIRPSKKHTRQTRYESGIGISKFG